MNIYRSAVLVSTVSIDEQTILTKKIMAADRINASFFSKTVLPIKLGDYVTFNGQNYFMNHLPTIDKQNDRTYKYDVIFQSALYDLYNKMLMSVDGLTEFSFTGNAEDILIYIVSQMNTIATGWAVGVVDATEIKTLQFVNDSCRSALTRLVEAFKFEFEVVGKTIHFKEAIGTIRNLTFEYGQNKGLYQITRKTVENNTLATRVYGFGASKNIPFTYRDHAKRLVFEERFLEKNVAIFGMREAQFTNDDIFPQRTSTLTNVNILFEAGVYNLNDSYVDDSTLDFNINDFLAEGLTPKIVFKSGELSGYQFEIWKYDHDNKRIYFNPFNESDGYVLPNPDRQLIIGDTYTLVDLKMPQSYINQAETDLKAATQVFLDENSVPKSLYLVKLDPKFAKASAIGLNAGDLVKVVDVHLGISSTIRVAQISFPIANVYKMDAIIADFIPKSLQEQIVISTQATSRIINNFDNRISNLVNNTINNTTQQVNNTTVEGNLKKITVFDKEFTWEKGFDNVQLEKLEAGDFIMDNWYSRYIFVKKWQYLGADDLPQTKNDRANWDELETLDNTP